MVFSSSVFLSGTESLDRWPSIKIVMNVAEGADLLLWLDVMVHTLTAFQVK